MTVSIVIEAERVELGPLQQVGQFSCFQTAKLYRGDEAVVHVTVQWPATEPGTSVVFHSDPRHAGPHD